MERSAFQLKLRVIAVKFSKNPGVTPDSFLLGSLAANFTIHAFCEVKS